MYSVRMRNIEKQRRAHDESSDVAVVSVLSCGMEERNQRGPAPAAPRP